jgi:hypothetical protein
MTRCFNFLDLLTILRGNWLCVWRDPRASNVEIVQNKLINVA